jgi:hypothetical protein
VTIAIRKPALGSAANAFLAKKHQMLSDGNWVDALSDKTFAVEDPATEEIIAHVTAGDKADIDLAVAAARRAFDSGPWSRISPAARQRLVGWIRTTRPLPTPKNSRAPDLAHSLFDNVMVWTAPAPASGSEKGCAKMVVVEQPI